MPVDLVECCSLMHSSGSVERCFAAKIRPARASDPLLLAKIVIAAVRPGFQQERAAEIAARTLALPDAQSVEDLTALLTSAGER